MKFFLLNAKEESSKCQLTLVTATVSPSFIHQEGNHKSGTGYHRPRILSLALWFIPDFQTIST